MLVRVLAMLMLLAGAEASLQTSEDYAVMGATAWAAFQCSTLVDKTERVEERQELFDLGYVNGKAFIEAWQSGKIEAEHVYRRVPFSVLDRLEPLASPQLPTADFALGAIWEAAARSVLDLIEESAAPIIFAKSEYSQRNCSSLFAISR